MVRDGLWGMWRAVALRVAKQKCYDTCPEEAKIRDMRTTTFPRILTQIGDITTPISGNSK
ncbi:MAG TPA: hypothetical protein PKV86_03015 [Syntrophobacteraceae bacterium]|nr:hypothetical protein [Syntrophobacteraceae bacterium]